MPKPTENPVWLSRYKNKKKIEGKKKNKPDRIPTKLGYSKEPPPSVSQSVSQSVRNIFFSKCATSMSVERVVSATCLLAQRNELPLDGSAHREKQKKKKRKAPKLKSKTAYSTRKKIGYSGSGPSMVPVAAIIVPVKLLGTDGILKPVWW